MLNLRTVYRSLSWHKHSHSSSLVSHYEIIFRFNQSPAPTGNSAALPPCGRSTDCERLRQFHRAEVIRGAGPMTHSHMARTLRRSIFNSQFKKHWSHQKRFLTAVPKKMQCGKVGQKLLHRSWLGRSDGVIRRRAPLEKYYSRLSHHIKHDLKWFFSQMDYLRMSSQPITRGYVTHKP